MIPLFHLFYEEFICNRLQFDSFALTGRERQFSSANFYHDASSPYERNAGLHYHALFRQPLCTHLPIL
jgi:hypothetical protein